MVSDVNLHPYNMEFKVQVSRELEMKVLAPFEHVYRHSDPADSLKVVQSGMVGR